MNVDNFSHAIDALRHNALLIDDDLCVNDRGRQIVCRRCEQVCDPKVIAAGADGIDLKEADCTGCGACVPACPASALKLTVFDPRAFVESLASDPTAHVHCSESRDAGGGMVIPCHRLIDDRLAATVMAGGTTELILHARPGCRECHRGDASGIVDPIRLSLRRWFSDDAMHVRWALPGEAAGQGKAIHQDQVRADRRGFLRLAGARAVASAAWLLPVAAVTAATNHEPREILVPGEFRKRASPHLAVLSARSDSLPWIDRVVLPWVSRSFTDGCSVCGVCARRCPTGALASGGEDGETAIAFDVALCTNCGLCVAVCPEHAVVAAPLRNAADVRAGAVVLVAKPVARCPQCGQVHTDVETGVCAQCRNEGALDDEWLAMLG